LATVVRVHTDVIVLNGGSSSGKSSIAVQLAMLLPQPFLTFGVDAFIDALPRTPSGGEYGIDFGPDGSVTSNAEFSRLEDAWYQGLAAMARDGAGLILDEVFLGGARAQERVRSVLTGLRVTWVGVRCDVDVAVAREAARPDRIAGMAASQAEVVHEGVHYDVQVDTTGDTALDCARTIAAYVTQ
jgi:chloramphenicol 3-O phosphotransferase